MTQPRPVGTPSPDSRRSESLRALHVLSEATSSLPGESAIEDWLGGFLGTMIRLAGAAAGAVRVVTADGKHLRLVASVGMPPEVAAAEKLMPVDCGACGKAMRAATVIEGPAGAACAGVTSLAWFSGFASMVVVPLSHQGRVLGAYNLFLAEARALPREAELLYRSIGEHLGMALENARLARENLRMTVMNERQMIANEVHDSLAQTMAYMKMHVALLVEALRGANTARALKYATELQQALGEAYADLRELLAQFRTRMDPLGLAHALEGIAHGFQDRCGIALEIDNRMPALDLTVDEEANVFHIVQEALANVARHSGAGRARLTLEEHAGEYWFTVEDDGAGFFVLGGRPGGDEEHNLRHHLGVNIMRERAQRLAGRIEIANLPRRGARVRLAFPADPAARSAGS